MDFNAVFNVFSRRPEGAAAKDLDVPKTTRSRIIQYLQTHFAGSMVSMEVWKGFWGEILQMLQMRLGTPLIHESVGGVPRPPSPEHAIRYVLEGSGAGFLDFLEDLFHTQTYPGMGIDANKFIDDINQLMRVDNLPYYLTKFATKETPLTPSKLYGGSRAFRFEVVAFPKVVMRESEVLHANAMEPALNLLRDPTFATANVEFLTALEDYRKGDYSDCLTKCGSAFESFMKIVCDKKGWPYAETDTAQKLIKAIIPNTSLEPYFEQLLIIVATLRNKLSSAHGAGKKPKAVPQHLAQYATNVTASAMILLAAEAGL